jgi:hypothetical protein
MKIHTDAWRKPKKEKMAKLLDFFLKTIFHLDSEINIICR